MTTKTSQPPLTPDEERLAHALISRGLVTPEEVLQCRAEGKDEGPEALLKRLVSAGVLTSNQASRATHELNSLMGQKIPGYQLLQKLGQGSMGTVFKARQLSMNRLTAVKVLQPRLATKPDFLQRFTREAHLAARLSHNNVVQAIDVGSAGKLHYFVMEYVEGTTIDQELKAGKIYDEQEAVQIILQIAQALQHAHRRELIHRDIKPANIILTTEGVAKLADLGMAREIDDHALAEAERGTTLGTPFYIAPEQIGGNEPVDSRADIYSLGATVYHMVTGQPPFPGNHIKDVLKSHLHKELTPPDHLNTKLSAGLGEVVEFMMAKDRRNRYQDPGDLIIDLECLLAGEAPKLARSSRLAVDALGAVEETGEEEVVKEAEAVTPPFPWHIVAAILGVLLVFSLFMHLYTALG
jgi:serine/threonine-protein kinase